jgi:hypothetical protein
VNEHVSLAAASGLTDQEISALRALLLRRRLKEAELWLKRRGIGESRVERILTEQEMAISSAIYMEPKWDLIFAVVSLLIAATLLGLAADAGDDLERAGPFAYRGKQRVIMIAVMVAPFFIASAFFTWRAMRQVARYLRARLRYRVRADAGFRS